MIKFATYCDGVGCNTHGNLVEWLTVDGWKDKLHFCSWNCLSKYGALMPWVEEAKLCNHSFNDDDVCVLCGYDDGERYMK